MELTAGIGERWERAWPLVRVVLVSLLLGVAGWLLSLSHADLDEPWTDAPWWAILAVAVGFGLAERFVFYVQYRREAIAYTMTELPMAVALLYVGLPWAVAARLAGSLVVIVVTERPSWYKVLFNASLLSFETVVGFVVFHAVAGDLGDPSAERVVTGLLLALVSLTLIDVLIVGVVISIFEGDFVERVAEQVRSTGPMMIASSAAATLVGAFSLVWPRWVLVGLVPLGAVWMLLRRNGRTTQQLRDFEALHRLSNSVSQSLHRDEIARVVVSEVQDILRSDRAAIMQVDGASGALSVLAATGEPFADLPRSLDDSRWRPFIDGAQPVVLEPMVLARLGISLGVRDNVIVAPVNDGDRTIGLLVVAERGGPQSSYDESDVLRAGAIANRLSSALRNAELHEQIEEEAWRDRLTGLPNRNSFEKAVAEAQSACSIGDVLGVIVLGIDRFREVNETLGHQVGDRILMEMSRRITAELDDDGLLARVTGDEFGVLMAPIDADALAAMARRLVMAMKQPFLVDDVEIIVEVGAGLATCSLCGLPAPDLVRQADVAMNWAKQHHTSVEMYRGEIDVHTPGRLALLADLRHALEHRQLDVWFQPKIDLVSGVVVGAEALVRWEHPTLGFVPPIQFVPLAETTGLVTELTDVVLAKSMAAVRLLNDVGFRLDVSVNLSTLDLLHEDLTDRVQRHLDDHQVPPDQLTLEITETALLEDGLRALSTAEALQSLGVHLSIDDFGTGFSSLSYLRKLPANEIKVDRSFVLNLLRDDRDEVIVRSTIDLGHNLGLKVTAEGVEDAATMERLTKMGCDLVQGYHIAKPMPLTHFVAWLTTSGHHVARSGIQGAWKPSASPLDA